MAAPVQRPLFPTSSRHPTPSARPASSAHVLPSHFRIPDAHDCPGRCTSDGLSSQRCLQGAEQLCWSGRHLRRWTALRLVDRFGRVWERSSKLCLIIEDCISAKGEIGLPLIQRHELGYGLVRWHYRNVGHRRRSLHHEAYLVLYECSCQCERTEDNLAIKGALEVTKSYV